MERCIREPLSLEEEEEEEGADDEEEEEAELFLVFAVEVRAVARRT
jgi:hypothetical protein